MLTPIILFWKALSFAAAVGALGVAAIVVAFPLDAGGAEAGQSGHVGEGTGGRLTVDFDDEITARMPLPALSMVVAD